MMNAIKYMDELESKGFTQEQAKTSVNLWIELMNENLVSKNDLLEVKTDLLEVKNDILELKSEVKDVVHKMDHGFLSVRHEMKEMESRLTIKLGTILVTGIGVLALLQKL